MDGALKLLFIYPDLGWNSVNFSPAIVSLSAYLKSRMKIQVKLLHLNEKVGMPYDLDKTYIAVREFEPDIIGFTCTTYSYQYTNEMAAYLKSKGVPAIMILGGSHATITPEDLESSALDGFCIGEGELPLLELCNMVEEGKDFTRIAGFRFKSSEGIIVNTPSPAITDLDVLPFRDYELMDIEEILKARNGWMNIAFSRGCPYACSFCINQSLKSLYKAGNLTDYFRCQSVDKVIAELIHWIEKYKSIIKIINFDDDLLMLKKDWFLHFCNKYKDLIYEQYKVKYVINARANLVDEDIVNALSDSGCHEVQIGFESGDEMLRNHMLNKQLGDEQLIRCFALCRKKEVRTLAYTMLGIPRETRGTVKKTLKLLGELKPTLIRLTIFDPFKGTPLYQYCKDKKLFKLTQNVQSNHFAFSNLVFDNLTDHEILLYHLLFPWYLNAISGGEHVHQYESLIEQYGKIPFNELMKKKTRKKVIEQDKIISDKMANEMVSHFRYFDKNEFYFEYVDYTAYQ